MICMRRFEHRRHQVGSSQGLLQLEDVLSWARDNKCTWPIDCGHRKGIVKQWHYVCHRGGNCQHCSTGTTLNESGSCCHDLESIFKGEDSRKASCNKLADTVPDHRMR